MIAITISSLINIAGIVASAFTTITPEDTNAIMNTLETSGLLFVLSTFIVSLILSRWQFKWFDSLW